jgi:hypothetical protein
LKTNCELKYALTRQILLIAGIIALFSYNQLSAQHSKDNTRPPEITGFLVDLTMNQVDRSLNTLAMVSNPSRMDSSFLELPRLIPDPSSTAIYSEKNRLFTGIPSLCISPQGRLWATWYAGPTAAEDQNNYVVISTSADTGRTWKEVLVIDPDGPGPVRAFDPETWIDPLGRLWFFWAQSIAKEEATQFNGATAGVWAITLDNPELTESSWPEPRRLTDGIMMCKPTVLSSGEWVLPASIWRARGGARMVISKDQGRHWHVRGSVDVPEDVSLFDEHMITERRDGSLWMLVRTRYGIGESNSLDRGRTWTSLIPSRIQHPTARFFIRRLSSGNLLLVKHGPLDMQTGRSHLMAFISEDDGYTWSSGLLLDERPGVSYPDGQQTGDGSIFIIYDYSRTGDQHILMTSFREEDVISSDDRKMIGVFRRRSLVSNGGVQ